MEIWKPIVRYLGYDNARNVLDRSLDWFYTGISGSLGYCFFLVLGLVGNSSMNAQAPLLLIE